MFTFKVVTQLDELNNLKDEWNSLHQNSIVQSFYNSYLFVYESIKYLQDPKASPYIIAVWFNDTLIGIFYLQKFRDSTSAIFNFKTLEFAALDEIDKPYPVIHKEFLSKAWEGLFLFLKKDKAWDIVSLMEQTHESFKPLKNSIQATPYILRVNPDKAGPILSLSDTWDNFLKKHKKLRQKIKVLNKQHENEYHFEIAQGKKLLDTYKEVEINSWKKGIQGIQKSNKFNDFYTSLIKESDSSDVIIGVLYIQNRPISAELCYISNDTVYLAQGCYDNAFSHLSPGMLSTAFLLQHFMEHDHLKWADGLCGYSHYLNSWSSHIVKTKQIDIYNLNIKVIIFFTLRALKKILKLPGVKNE